MHNRHRRPKQDQPKTSTFKRRYPVVKTLLAWSLLLILILASTVVVKFSSFSVSATPCSKSNLQPCSQQVIDVLAGFQGIHPLKLKQSEIHAVVSNADPEAQFIETKFLPPGTLSITYTDTLPFAAIQVASQSAYTVVANSGVIIDIDQNVDAGITVINHPGFSSQPIGEIVSDPAITATLQLLHYLNQSGITPISVTIQSPQRILIALDDGRIAIFTNQSDILAQVTSLQLILSESTINPSLPVIDVRFQKPVLKPSI